MSGTLYIGMTTRTGGVLTDEYVMQAIIDVFNDLGIDGATFTWGAGMWRTKVERTVLVRVEVEYRTLQMLVGQLCVRLNQEFIGWVPSQPMEFLS